MFSWRILGLFVALSFIFGLDGCVHVDRTTRVAEPSAIEGLANYVRKHGLLPEEYIVNKLRYHDIVFLGEYHRIKHDVEFVCRLIPVLHRNGMHRLGYEHVRYADQHLLDTLVTADSFDVALANKILWNDWPFWGYKEYRDVLYVAWKVNSALKDGEEPFRIIGLAARSDWSHVWTPEDRQNPEIMRKVRPDGNPDAFMAQVIHREFIEAAEKGVIFAGMNHCYTEYQQPAVDDAGRFVRFEMPRIGNLIFEAIGKRCITVSLHKPWPSAGGWSKPNVRPADGVIDAVIHQLYPEHLPAAVDVQDSPFGALKSETRLWKQGYDNFTLADYCDGYIMFQPFSKYEGVTPIEGWFTEDNRLEAISQASNPHPAVKNPSRSIEDLSSSLAESADIQRRLKHLH
jgi:hypothetical protein